jgi:biopolymer transport protein ExbD
MPPTTLLRAGIVTLLVGIVLIFTIPLGLTYVEMYLASYRMLDRLVAPVLFWFCVSLIGAGGMLVFRAAFGLVLATWQWNPKLQIFPAMPLRNVLAWHRHRPTPLIAQPPNFGLIFGAVLWILIVLAMVLREPIRYRGLPIDLRTYDLMIWEKSPWQETLSVYIAVGEKYYLNGQLVPREALRSHLQEALRRRMVWTVYLEADYDTLNVDAIYAIDAIQGLGAKLVWITPRVREELQKGTDRRGSDSTEVRKNRLSPD